jgi:predicted nucleic acid-binding protein
MKNRCKQFLGFFLIAALFTSCSINMLNRVNGNRNVVVKERKLQDNFSGIIVSTGIEVLISQKNSHSITVEADENLHDMIITEVQNDILKIYCNKNIWRAKAKKVYVTLENLALLKATSGSDVRSETVIKTNEISVTASSGADIYIEVEVENLETNATSGADLMIFGTATNHAARATSGSAIDAYSLKSNNVIVEATSGANIRAYASKKIEARATSGGAINFKGNPAVINKKTTSGGSISKN